MLEQHINLAFSYFTESTGEVEEIYRDWRDSRYHIPWPRRFPILGRLINRRQGMRELDSDDDD